jgi:hypothetical protein
METAFQSFRQFFRYPIVKGGGEVATNPRIYTASGAIAITPGLHLLQGAGPLLMTLAQPTAAQEGMILTIYNSTAAAHTVTAAGGFGGGGPTADRAVFPAGFKAGIVLMAVSLHWTVLGQNGLLFD